MLRIKGFREERVVEPVFADDGETVIALIPHPRHRFLTLATSDGLIEEVEVSETFYVKALGLPEHHFPLTTE